jgi:hypothetical protein
MKDHTANEWMVQTTTYPIQAFLGDSILVYRTWVVTQRDWRFVILPILLLVGDLLTASGLAYSEHHLLHGEYSDPTVAPWAAAFAGVTLALNLICTGKRLSFLQLERIPADKSHKG